MTAHPVDPNEKSREKKFCLVGKIHYRNCIYVILESILRERICLML